MKYSATCDTHTSARGVRVCMGPSKVVRMVLVWKPAMTIWMEQDRCSRREPSVKWVIFEVKRAVYLIIMEVAQFAFPGHPVQDSRLRSGWFPKCSIFWWAKQQVLIPRLGAVYPILWLKICADRLFPIWNLSRVHKSLWMGSKMNLYSYFPFQKNVPLELSMIVFCVSNQVSSFFLKLKSMTYCQSSRYL